MTSDSQTNEFDIREIEPVSRENESENCENHIQNAILLSV